MWQYIIIGIILLAATAYVAGSLKNIFTSKGNDPCHGCNGCTIKKEMLKHSSHGRFARPACSHKNK